MPLGGLTDTQADQLTAAVNVLQNLATVVAGQEQRIVAAVTQVVNDAVVAPALAKVPTPALWAELARRAGFRIDITPVAPPPPPPPRVQASPPPPPVVPSSPAAS